MPERSMTTPPSHVEKPATLWPPPRTAMTRSCSRAKRTAVDLCTRHAEHETDCCDELAVPARDRLSTLHELISIERERLRLDLVPAVREQDVLDLVELNAESHLAPPWCPTLCARAQGSAV